MSISPKLTSKSKLGLLIWCFCLLLISYTPRILSTFYPSPPIEISIHTKHKIKQLNQNYSRIKNRFKKRQYHLPPRKFNPNEYSETDWMALGLSRKQAAAIKKFCKYPLKSNEDLARIFVIPKELFIKIKDSTFYSNSSNILFRDEKGKTPTSNQQKISVPLIINVATLDSTSLISIKGIGPFYAKMVLKYERALGGFYDPKQLLEVYKMNDKTYQILIAHLDFSSPNIRKISINRASVEELAKHPYLSWWQANSIVKMRTQMGGYHSIDELLNSHLINQDAFDKIEPYVSL